MSVVTLVFLSTFVTDMLCTCVHEQETHMQGGNPCSHVVTVPSGAHIRGQSFKRRVYIIGSAHLETGSLSFIRRKQLRLLTTFLPIWRHCLHTLSAICLARKRFDREDGLQVVSSLGEVAKE
jgi:hypothetical protein